MALNSVVLMGRITKDIELHTTKSGIEVCSFSIAIDRKFSKGEDKKTDFIPIVCWRQTAVFVSKYFHKGSLIALQGELQTREYEDNNGNKRTQLEVVASDVSFCGGKDETPTQPTSINIAVEDEDDLPF